MNENVLINDLLIEFLTEELPPINLEKIYGEIFLQELTALLNSFYSHTSTASYFVTPRRFGIIITQLKNQEAAQKIAKKGPAINTSLSDGVPTKALLGFMKSCGVNQVSDLEQNSDGYFYYHLTTVGKKLTEILPDAIKNALKKLPIAKNMRWGNNDYSFVRPLHNLLILYGNQTICQNSKIMQLFPVNYTYGHRVLSTHKIIITEAKTYATQLEQEGYVIADFTRRRQLIKEALTAEAVALDLYVAPKGLEQLIDEVTALVEYPVILQGKFDGAFLAVPQECLMLSMAKNQKYFALLNKNDELSNRFLFVANILSKDSQVIIKGNEKVLSARLNDAKFFFETDKKHDLDYFLNKLNSVVYHNKLGTQQQRLNRLLHIALKINQGSSLTEEDILTAVSWLKADLVTEMVGEFPELQGVMGKYYALHKGIKPTIATSIEQHYYPRFAGDIIPQEKLAILMALSDKLELLIGMWGIGLAPTGEKDPFALRRAALGIIRILLESDCDLFELIKISVSSFANTTTFEQKLNPDYNESQVGIEVYTFILNRLANYLITELEFKHSVVHSVLNSFSWKITNPGRKTFIYLIPLLQTLSKFSIKSENQELFQANKRIENILRKNKDALATVFSLTEITKYLVEDSEKELLDFIHHFDTANLTPDKWDMYFSKLEQCSKILEKFFTHIMVMTDDINLRMARLSLLTHLQQKVNSLCDMSALIH